MDVRKVIGENLRRSRVSQDLTQEVVAERMGLDRAYISGLERGERNPTAITLWRLATALGIEPAELLKRPEPLSRSKAKLPRS
ncbi:MAG TPA: helix-turn-helix transcriptional regulator [Alphaproteobacteria bacterium]